MSEQLLTVKEVSKLLGVHVNTVRAMAEDGRLQGMKTKGENGHWRFKESDVQSFMGSNKNMDISSILNDIIYIEDEVPESLTELGNISNKGLWDFVNRHYGIRSVFGSYAIHAEMDTYREIISLKGFVWLGEGAVNVMESVNRNKNGRDKFYAMELENAFGVVKHPTRFGEDAYSLVPLLVVTDRHDKKWIVDGTLQQFYPNLEKGLSVLPYEKAKHLYIGLEIYNKKKFVELYSDPFVSERFIEKAKQLENEQSDND